MNKVLAVAVCAVLGAACGGSTSEAPTPATEETQTAPVTSGDSEATPAPAPASNPDEASGS